MRISTQTFSLMAAALFAVGLAGGAGLGCSSSSNSSDDVGTCTRFCQKYVSCNGDAAAAIGFSASNCMSICMSQANKATCSNADQVAAAANACLGMSDCTAFTSCYNSAVKCQAGATGGASGTGTGGHTGGGTGGTTGGAGSGGSADCAICDKASACCTAVGLGATCGTYSAATCNASGATAAYASGCQQFLTGAAMSGNAACQ